MKYMCIVSFTHYILNLKEGPHKELLQNKIKNNWIKKEHEDLDSLNMSFGRFTSKIVLLLTYEEKKCMHGVLVLSFLEHQALNNLDYIMKHKKCWTCDHRK